MAIAGVIRAQREALNLTQGQLAAAVGVDARQIRRYEAGETQPPFSVAIAIAKALQLSLDELAGETTHRADLDGAWWASWQTFIDGKEVVNPQEVNIEQHGETAGIATVSRGALALEQGGYHWRGEVKLWDNEILTGWYTATEGAVRSKGVMFFVLHPHGLYMSGRWVGLSYDGPIVSGWASMARTEEDSLSVITHLKEKGQPPQ